MDLSIVIPHRIHALAGTVDPSAPESVKRAEETYIANLKYAADECAKVAIASCSCSSVKSGPSLLLLFPSQNGIMLLIEPISTIQNYFLRHQQQGKPFFPCPGSIQDH